MLTALKRHPWRPAHLHIMITAPGYERLATHIFKDGSDHLDSDAVFGVRSTLISEWVRCTDPMSPYGRLMNEPFRVALGVEGTPPGAALYDLAVELGAPTELESLGVGESDMQRAADIALQNPYWNPAPIEHDAILKLLTNALQGNRPA